MDKQCSKATNEANERLGIINRNFKCKVRKVILPLYKSIVKEHLEMNTACRHGDRTIGKI